MQKITSSKAQASDAHVLPASRAKEPKHVNKAFHSRAVQHLHTPWREILQCSDAEALWRELYHLVSRHPVVRNARGNGLLFEEGRAAHSDLVQDLFVILLGKNRFQHYLESGMTDAGIEAEISQIELKNLLSANLRKKYPESYRLARRISELIQESSRFRRFDQQSGEHAPRALAEHVYGLRHWPQGKARRPAAECQDLVKQIPTRKRDTRLVGRGGNTQLIISNADLEDLIVGVFKAIDSPFNLRILRSLVMSRLPLMDVHLVSMTRGREDDQGFFYDHADNKENPEESLLGREAGTIAERLVDGFLISLREDVRGKSEKYKRMLEVLWHCYLSSKQMTQLEAADRVGVSDSLVSDYRHRIERLLRTLPLGTLEEAKRFEQVLCETVKKLIGTD